MNTPVSSVPESSEVLLSQNLVIYTSTFYDNSEESIIRSKLCFKFLENVQKLGIHCVICDGGSTNQEFVNTLKSFPYFTLISSQQRRMGAERRSALQEAIALQRGNTYFLWAEPEKDDLITQDNLTALISGAVSGDFDIVVPKRIGVSGIPKFQGWIEQRANHKISKAMREKGVFGDTDDLDLWFGPKLFTQKGAAYFLQYESSLDKWDSIIKPVYNAAKDGLKVGSIGVHYIYDVTQSANESDESNRKIREKRVEQYRLIIREILGKDTKTL